jgi:hypothetical protein
MLFELIMRFRSIYGVSSYELSIVVWVAGCFCVHVYPVTTSRLYLYTTKLVWCFVRCQGTNRSGLIGRLGRPIRVTFRYKMESLLRGQVILSI